MIKGIIHVGVTVSDMDRSIKFYRDVLGLKFLGEILMEGEETQALFGRKNARARVAYLNGDEKLIAPPVELIEFTDEESIKDGANLFKTSISEICFRTDDIYNVYETLKNRGVEFLSEPQSFDFSPFGFGKSKAVYFKDPDGIILELTQSEE